MRTVKTRVLIISDTHCAVLKQDGEDDRLFSLPLPSADVLIHCGDLTHTGTLKQYGDALDMLKHIDAPVKIVIAGNHDLSLDHEFVMVHHNRVGETRQAQSSKEGAEALYEAARHLWTTPDGRAVREGISFLDEGDHEIELHNGASLKLYATPYTPAFCDWGFAHEQHQDRFNEKSVTPVGCENIAERPVAPRSSSNRPYDIIITHGPPRRILDRVVNGTDVGCPHLLRAVARARPLVHCFGHIHEAWGAERVRWTADADRVASTDMTLADFDKHGWQRLLEARLQKRTVSDDDRTRHAVYEDLSATGARPLQTGRETFFVNAAIMTVRGRPDNAPWLLDIDLPVAADTTT